ncbi:LysR family transcriptional regulator [Achromobacter ruhlandii]|uniref:HTH lysR-type domain-containing protein n=1 Tax=Achromobacter ruhlandii TaxID=72557 RepID=A0ABM8LY42_9BURK|nr:LysR family transcriptional regulator [Achromobacter ruhlandii]AOU92660.1 LysR family transcriptional regulator [Achromobacter ruhlandii]MCZ8430830.1 LysR family transcriptional regulator [Achromobacter ruhlandii]MDC6087819.1 LysR family transcriptional regulator [Achromobacter ruhlandii]MDC6150300.1 LysR family transcriptional regulator [Achromobacter ruhlandii]MDD7978595.1 LysR family transcriptional regulator [Achromobacter ruhlandii]
MEWNDVRIFLAVARGGSFGEAARALGVSHPTVGRRIKVLEDEARQPLFRRTKDGLVLTDAGDTVRALAESMEDSALSMERRLTGNDQRLEGILRISSADWFAGYVLAPVLVELTRRHPAVVPEVIASHRLLDLSRREADVAFRIVPFNEPDIVQRRLMRISYGVYGSMATAQALGDDPASVGVILMNTAQSHFPDVAWVLERFPRCRRAFTSTNRSVQAQMCLRDMGIAVLPRALGDAVPGLQRIHTPDQPPTRDIWVGYHQDLRHMDRLRAMLDIADMMLSESSSAAHSPGA